jgi:hypothetical protein
MASRTLEELEASLQLVGVLPFKVLESDVREQMRHWHADQSLAPNAFRRLALVDQVRGVYVPYWIVGAKVQCGWEAQSGTFVNRDSGSRARRDREVQWEPAAGLVDHVFDDILVPGTTGIPGGLLKGLDPWPLEALVPYDRAFLSGFSVERCQIAPAEAAKAARKDMDRLIRNLCELDTPGDTFRFLRIAPEYSAETFKLILVPVWLLSYRYRGKTYQVAGNGCTGTVKGDAPTSVWKMLAVCLFLLALVLAALFGLRALSGH